MDAWRRHLLALEVRDLSGAALLDGDCAAVRQPGVDGGHRRGNVERDPAHAAMLVILLLIPCALRAIDTLPVAPSDTPSELPANRPPCARSHALHAACACARTLLRFLTP